MFRKIQMELKTGGSVQMEQKRKKKRINAQYPQEVGNFFRGYELKNSLDTSTIKYVTSILILDRMR